MSHLDDTNERPVQQKFLDLLSLRPNLKDEVQSALHKLAELKLRPEKIPDDEDVVKPASWKSCRASPYLDPVPQCMLHVNIRQLSTVSIDWKMLTLDRPESQVEIQIFSRMVYLDKLLLKCLAEEKAKKAQEKFVRLRTKGRPKPPADSDADKSDEFTYEYFSRFAAAADRPKGTEEVAKPKPAEEPKPRPTPASEEPPPNVTPPLPPARRRKTRPKKAPARRKRLKKRRKKKTSRRPKLRKRKMATLKDGKPKAARKPKPARKRPNKMSAWNRTKSVASRPKRRLATSKATLVQMLKNKEQKDRKKALAGGKSKKAVVTPRKP